MDNHRIKDCRGVATVDPDEEKNFVDKAFVEYVQNKRSHLQPFEKAVIYFAGHKALKDTIIQFQINCAVVASLILASTFASLFGKLLSDGNTNATDDINNAAIAAYFFNFLACAVSVSILVLNVIIVTQFGMCGNARYDVIWFVNRWMIVIWTPVILIILAVGAVLISMTLASYCILPPTAFWVTVAVAVVVAVSCLSMYMYMQSSNGLVIEAKVSHFEQLVCNEQYEEAERFLTLSGYDYQGGKVDVSKPQQALPQMSTATATARGVEYGTPHLPQPTAY